jgi:hypothetical protein
VGYATMVLVMTATPLAMGVVLPELIDTSSPGFCRQ